MPKFSLPRINTNSITSRIDSVISNIQSKISSGVSAFKELRDPLISSDQIKVDVSLPNGLETPFQAAMPEVYFKRLSGEEKLISDVYYISIDESMDNLYRTGSLTVIDTAGFVELTGITNTLEGEYVKVEIKNKFEGTARVIKFGLYDMKDEPWNNKTTYKLMEEPFYTNYHKKVINKGYSQARATQLIATILGEVVSVPALNLIENPQDDPKFPSFIFPNWTAAKSIKYLSQYSSQGPIKVFNVSLGGDVVTMVAPLEKFISGQVYSSELKIFPTVTERIKDGIKLNKWTLFGPNINDKKNKLSGETVMSFSYFSGKNGPEDFKTFGVENYEFENLLDKSYATIVGGVFKEGVKLVNSNLGNQLFHKKETMSEKEHSLTLDVEEKPLVQAKIKSRFYQSFHDEIMLRVIIPASSNVNVGQIFDIIIPSELQPSSNTNNENASLSGKWLLWSIQHKLTPERSRMKYEMHCYFYRTGFSIANQSRNVDKV